MKDKCREVEIGSLGEASQVEERVNESRGKTLLHFTALEKGRTNDEIFGEDCTKFRGPLDLTEVRGGYSVSVEEV
jgi:hypothetical protein